MAASNVTLERALGHRFADPALLVQALTHPSVSTARRRGDDYERLEFLGDRVLGLVIASRLFARDGGADAGVLAVRYNALVRKDVVAEVAREIGLGDHLRISAGEKAQGGADKAAILADACEALIAAVYLDGGFEAAGRLIDRYWGTRLEAAALAGKDSKTRLQELIQGRGSEPPRYRIVDRQGPEHAPVFTVEVTAAGCEPVRGSGASRRAAEQDAAAGLLAVLGTGAHDG